MSRIIEVIVAPSGEVRLQTKGFAGGECRQASQFLEQALGSIAREQLTGEFYQGQVQHERAQEKH